MYFLHQSFFSILWRQNHITKDDLILSNDPVLMVNTALSPNSAEEADKKLVRHALQCSQAGIGTVVVRTVDTGIILLLLAHAHRVQGQGNIFAWLASGKTPTFYDITSLSSSLGTDRCRALPYFHAFSGSDLTSFFFNQGKCWDRWEEFSLKEELTPVFFESRRITEHHYRRTACYFGTICLFRLCWH